MGVDALWSNLIVAFVLSIAFQFTGNFWRIIFMTIMTSLKILQVYCNTYDDYNIAKFYKVYFNTYNDCNIVEILHVYCNTYYDD